MTNFKALLLGIMFYMVGQVFTYYQLNGQFIWPWFKRNPLALSLLGIPISIKDTIHTKDIPTTFGSIVYKNFIPKEDLCSKECHGKNIEIWDEHLKYNEKHWPKCFNKMKDTCPWAESWD